MGDLEALLFDVDGTLADTEGDGHLVAFNRAFAEAGLDWHWDTSLYGELLAITGGKERIRFYLQEFNTGFEIPSDAGDFIAELHRLKTAHYTRILEQGEIALRPGVERLLDEAQASGLRLGIATTTSPVNVTNLLRSTLGDGGASRFEVIAAGDMVQAKKPAPDVFSYAMDQMQLDPNRCLAVEDSNNGVRSAYGAGIRAIVVTVNEFTRGEDFTDAGLVVNHLGDPGSPCFALSGDLKGRELVDVAVLRDLHRDSVK